jgi:hypothetical protein
MDAASTGSVLLTFVNNAGILRDAYLAMMSERLGRRDRGISTAVSLLQMGCTENDCPGEQLCLHFSFYRNRSD